VVGTINAPVGWISFALAKSESQAKIRFFFFFFLNDSDFYSRNENLQNAFCLECIFQNLNQTP
jgi:hypothetical protein